MQTNKPFRDSCLVPTVTFLQFSVKFLLVVETVLKNIRCLTVFIVKLVLGSLRKQGIVFSYVALEYEVEKINKLPLNAVVIFFFSKKSNLIF